MASEFTLTSDSYSGRYMQLYCKQSKDIANNKSTISWTLSSIGGSRNYYSTGPTTVTINGEQAYYKDRVDWTEQVFPAAKGSTSGTVTVSHDEVGDASIIVSLSTAIYIGADSVTKYSGTWELDNIPRKAILNYAPDFTEDDSPTINYSNPAGNSLTTLQACISFTGENQDIRYRDVPKTGTSYTFEFTEEEKNTLRNAAPDGTKKVFFYLSSLIGGINYYSTIEKTYTVADSSETKPTVSLSITPNNDSIPQESRDKFEGLYIQNISKVVCTLSATGKFGATIKEYSGLFEGKAYSVDENNKFISEAITNSSSKYVYGYARDSRNHVGETFQELEVIPYSRPIISPLTSQGNVVCARWDETQGGFSNSGESLKIQLKKNFSSVSSKNKCRVYIKIQEEGQSTIKTKTLSGYTDADTYNGVVDGVTLDKKKSYKITIFIRDNISAGTPLEFSIPTEDVPFHLGAGGTTVSFGEYADKSKPHSVQINWDVYIGDDKLSDCVIEQGISGSWKYRKWKSGILEQWAVISPIFSSWNKWVSDNWFNSDGVTIDFAKSFAQNTYPVINATNYQTSWAIPMIENVTNINFKIYGVRPNAGLISTNEYYFSIYAVGQWK